MAKAATPNSTSSQRVEQRPEPDFYDREHRSLVSGDRSSAERLAAALLVNVVAALRRRLPSADHEYLGEAVDDALMDYFRQPGRYDSSRGTLVNYVANAATRNILNARRGAWRRYRAESLAANSRPAIVDGGREFDSWLRANELLSTCCCPEEIAFARLWLQGGSLEELAELSGMSNAAESVKRSAIRRVTERLRQRFKRHFRFSARKACRSRPKT